MKRFLFFTFLSVASIGRATTNDDAAYNLKVERAAYKLFAQQRGNEAVAYLTQNLRADNRGVALEVATTRSLVDISLLFRERRVPKVALAAANLAISWTSTAVADSPNQPGNADLLYSAGLLCELVAFDTTRAAICYRAALAAKPDHALALEHLARITRP